MDGLQTLLLFWLSTIITIECFVTYRIIGARFFLYRFSKVCTRIRPVKQVFPHEASLEVRIRYVSMNNSMQAA